MELNEIKKVLYKEKPTALLYGEEGSPASNDYTFIYFTVMSIGEVTFRVPVSEMGEKVFGAELPAQLLIRWMVYGG